MHTSPTEGGTTSSFLTKLGSTFEHTSSVDEHDYDPNLVKKEDVVPPSVGLVCVQKGKLLSVPEKHKEALEEFVCFPILGYHKERKAGSKDYPSKRFKKRE
jgi:hypothetical protein